MRKHGLNGPKRHRFRRRCRRAWREIAALLREHRGQLSSGTPASLWGLALVAIGGAIKGHLPARPRRETRITVTIRPAAA